MPMRTDCKHYESRTYASGEAMRRCRLDRAPDAPWRCPENCLFYERRTTGAGWTLGSLQAQPAPDEPRLDGAANLLDQAEDIVNAAGPRVLAEVEQARRPRHRAAQLWRRLFRRG